MQPNTHGPWRMVGVELAISIPGPRQVSLSSDVDGGSQDLPARRPFPRMQQPAVRHISRPSRPAAPTAMVSHRVRRPTPPCHMTQPRCCTAQSMKPIFLESVHLGPVLRSAPLSLSLSVHPGPMEQDAIVCKSPFNSLSRHLLEQWNRA